MNIIPHHDSSQSDACSNLLRSQGKRTADHPRHVTGMFSPNRKHFSSLREAVPTHSGERTSVSGGDLTIIEMLGTRDKLEVHVFYVSS